MGHTLARCEACEGAFMAVAKKKLSPLLVSVKGQWHIIVPWDRADRLHERLKQGGYRSTLWADPSDHDAGLELWPGVDPAKAFAALASN
jgi:hypothetical protein